MSGVLGALAAPLASTHAVTIGSGGTQHGFAFGGYGNVLPIGVISSGSYSLIEINNDSAAYDFRIRIDDSLGSATPVDTFFKSIVAVTANRRFLTSAATITIPLAGAKVWTWGNGTNRVWTATGSDRILLYY